MFSVFQGEVDGLPLIATIDTDLREHKSKGNFPWLLSLSTPLIDPTKNGLPTPGDSKSVNEWEDLIERQISTACEFVYVGHVTWNSSREVLYYVDRVEPVASLLKKLNDDHSTRPFAFRCERDDKWDKISVYFTR